MRIIAGNYRSRPLKAPEGLSTRPTSDRLRETLFNVLASRIEGARFADLYAGSGAVGLEAISRGVGTVVFVEKAQAALRVLRGNLQGLGITGGYRVHEQSVHKFFSTAANNTSPLIFDLVFLDPPYEAEEEYDATLGLLGRGAAACLAPGALVVAEHRKKSPPDECYGVLHRTRLLQQGDAALSFYAAPGNPGT